MTEREALVRLQDAAATLARSCRALLDVLGGTLPSELVTPADWRAEVRRAWVRVDEAAGEVKRAQR